MANRCTALGFALLVALVPGLPVLSNAASVARHPVESVIGMLQDLGQRAKQDGNIEEELYTRFEHWCQDSSRTLSKAIKVETAKVARLQDSAASQNKSAGVLHAQIEKSMKEIFDLQAAEHEAGVKRDWDMEVYDKAAGSHIQVVEALMMAIEELTAVLESATAGASLLGAQGHVSRIVELLGEVGADEEREQLEALAAAAVEPKEPPDLKAAGDYGSHVKPYTFKSENIIGLLKELKARFELELEALHTEETNAKNAHELSLKASTQVIDSKDASRMEKERALADMHTSLSQTQADLDSVRWDLATDSESLKSTGKVCEVKRMEWAERSRIRKGEIEAIEAAVEILAKVAGVRTQPPVNPALPPPPASAPPSLLQVSSPKVEHAINLLRKEAARAHSSTIDQLVKELSATRQGPFDKVVAAIQKMIARLLHEQRQEDDHKNWCDLELSKTSKSASDKEAKLSELAIKIENHDLTAYELQEGIREADAFAAELRAHMKESTEIRRTGKHENEVAIKDAKDAQAAIANAISVLTTFYKSSGAMQKESYEFAQFARQPVQLPDSPPMWASSYTSVTDPTGQPGGIITVLEQVSADFSRMESDTKAQEEADQQAYDEDVQSCSIELARRRTESEMKAQERKRTLESMSTRQAEQKAVSGELAATSRYMRELEPACVQGDSSYEDRKAARTTEIEALREAQAILQAPAPSFLQRRLRGVA